MHGLATIHSLNAKADAKAELWRNFRGAKLNIAVADRVNEIVDRSGFDLSRCGGCGFAVICIPDGLPICEPCAAKAGA